MDNAYSPVPELNLLKKFQDRYGFEDYADGFGLIEFGDASGLVAGWSADPGFLGRLIPFAQANGGGSFYAFWRLDGRDDFSSLPVVVFGDEGGQHVVARCLRELFQLLGYDCEISVDWESAYFYLDEDDEDYERSRGHEAYVAWLDQNFGLPPAQVPDNIIKEAQTEFGARFVSWSEPYLAHWSASGASGEQGQDQ